jgi:glycosyltransferase involved in cell wall biosynthesis
MNILHLPSWYPSIESSYNGIFIKEFIENFAIKFPENKNFVITNLDEKSISFKINNIIENIKMVFKKKNIALQNLEIKNMFLFNIKSHYTYSHRLGFNVENSTFKHYETLFSNINSKDKIDVIHAHVSFPCGYIAYLISKKYKIPFIITEHAGNFDGYKFLTKNKKLIPYVQQSIDNAAAIVAVSNHLKAIISQHTDTKISIIPNLIDDTFFIPKNSTFDCFTFISISSRINTKKGFDELFEAIVNFIKQDATRNVRFIIGGNGNDLGLINRWIALNPMIADKIIPVGTLTRTQVRDMLQQSQCFVLASHSETFGMVYAESIACGIPVIATKCGGPEDFIDNSVGILIPIKNVISLTQALNTIYYNHSKYDKEAIRLKFLSKLNMNKILNAYSELYENI